MANILALETTGKFCSIAVSFKGQVLKWIDSIENNHSAVLHQSILNLLKENNIKLGAMEAVALSAGPGSYTGLRVGSSSAKGLCLALDIPLISVPTHKSMLLTKSLNDHKSKYVLCVTDARREDVFASLYKEDDLLHGVEVLNINELDWLEQVAGSNLSIIGSGAHKIKQLGKYIPSLYVENECLSGEQVLKVAISKYERSEFEDLANYEPRYEKEFYSTQKIK